MKHQQQLLNVDSLALSSSSATVQESAHDVSHTNQGQPDPAAQQASPGHESRCREIAPGADLEADTTLERSTTAVGIFRSGHEVAVQLTAKGQAHARHILADKGTADSAAAQLPSSEEESDANKPAPPAVKPPPIASGFSLGTGNPVQLTAKGRARVHGMFEEHNQGHDAPLCALTTDELANKAAPVKQQAPAPSLFQSGSGRAVQTTARGRAHAEKLFVDGTEAAQTKSEVNGTVAPQLAVASSADCPKGSCTGAPAAAPVASGFSFGTGKAVQLSAKALAKSKDFFQGDNKVNHNEAPQPAVASRINGLMDGNTEAPAAAPAASGFSFGTGKAVQLSAKALAKSKDFFQDEDDTTATEEPQPAVGSQANGPKGSITEAPVAAPVASGFSFGTGKAVQLSTQALAKSRSFFQDQNDAPNPAESADTAPAATPAVAVRPDIKLAGSKPVLGTPTALATPTVGSTGVKPTLKRGMTVTSSSTDGKQYKKVRMSKLVTPSCLGVPLNRVRVLAAVKPCCELYQLGSLYVMHNACMIGPCCQAWYELVPLTRMRGSCNTCVMHPAAVVLADTDDDVHHPTSCCTPCLTSVRLCCLGDGHTTHAGYEECES